MVPGTWSVSNSSRHCRQSQPGSGIVDPSHTSAPIATAHAARDCIPARRKRGIGPRPCVDPPRPSNVAGNLPRREPSVGCRCSESNPPPAFPRKPRRAGRDPVALRIAYRACSILLAVVIHGAQPVGWLPEGQRNTEVAIQRAWRSLSNSDRYLSSGNLPTDVTVG